MRFMSVFRRLALLAVVAIPVVGLSSEAGAVIVYNATFEGQTVGNPLPTGAPPGLPSSIDLNLTAIVEDAASVAPQAALTTGNFARPAESAGEAPDLSFDSGTSFTTGVVTISMDLLFESLERYHILFREGSGVGGAAINMADVLLDDVGGVTFQSNGGTVGTSSYAANTPIHFEAVFDLDNNIWDATWGGLLVVDDAAIFDEALGLVAIGFRFSGFTPLPSGQDGVMQLDNYVFDATLTAVPEPSSAALFGLGLLGLAVARRRRKAA